MAIYSKPKPKAAAVGSIPPDAAPMAMWNTAGKAFYGAVFGWGTLALPSGVMWTLSG